MTSTQVLDLHDVLHTYNIHHTGYEAEEEAAPTVIRELRVQPTFSSSHTHQETPLSAIQGRQSNVAWRRRIPPYRPVNRDHRLSSRPAGLNAVQAAMNQAVFIGVYIQGVGANIHTFLRYSCHARTTLH
jgi:hypothetical protein